MCIRDSHEALLVEVLRVDDRREGVGEDLELIGDAHVVAVGRDTVGDPAGADLPVRCLLYTSPSPRDRTRSRMPSSA
mgnify:CR=1 FL=1